VQKPGLTASKDIGSNLDSEEAGLTRASMILLSFGLLSFILAAWEMSICTLREKSLTQDCFEL
jgi:hypothetical protein